MTDQSELRRLEPLVGTWMTDDHTEDSVLGPGVQVTSRETFSWFDGGYFSNNGPFTEEGNRYRGEVAGGTLTFEGPARFQYRLDHDGRIELGAGGTLSVAWWLRDQNGNWQPWMHNAFRRLE
jgi:hypothetical protein